MLGRDLFAMMAFYTCIWRRIHARLLANEVCAFAYNQTGSVHSREQVSTKMTELGMANKRASTEAYQAFEPHNMIIQFRQLWTLSNDTLRTGSRKRIGKWILRLELCFLQGFFCPESHTLFFPRSRPVLPPRNEPWIH